MNINVTDKKFYEAEENVQSEQKLLNYLTAPNVVIWSAVLCSCAIPVVFEAQELMCKE